MGGESRSIYIGKVNLDYEKSWIVIDPPGGSDTELRMDRSSLLLERPPEELEKLVFSSAVAWGSKIYFVGGLIDNYSKKVPDDEGTYSNKVFCFDTESDEWEQDDLLSPMGSPRVAQAVAAVAAQIYVFGFLRNDPDSGAIWAECYDIGKNEWNYLQAPPQEWPCGVDILSCAVYGRLILFWLGGFGPCSLDTVTNSWNLDLHPQLQNGPTWNKTPAVVDNCMYWHHQRNLYAYDFITNQSISVFNLEEHLGLDAYEAFTDYAEIDTHLVHVGDGRLCFVWGDRCQRDLIHYYSFLINTHGSKLVLEFEEHMPCTVPCYLVHHVLLL